MATYIHPNGQTITTAGTNYTITHADGTTSRTVDISNWTNDAEKWIDNDIAAGLYGGFKKVGA